MGKAKKETKTPPNAAKVLGEKLRADGYVAVVVALVSENHVVEHWFSIRNYGEGGILLGAMHVTAMDLALAIREGEERE